MTGAHTRKLGRLLVAPAVIVLFAWMIIPLGMTIYFSFLQYSFLDPLVSFTGWSNYIYFVTDPAFSAAMLNTLLLIAGVLLISVVGGLLLALLLDQPIYGQRLVRLLVITPFFVMPTVSALVWKNMLMNPVYGLFAWVAQSMGLQPFDFFASAPLLSIILIVSWQWLPFATLILLTSLQSLDREQQEAAEMDGASAVSRLFHITLPHISRPITVIILVETIFLLNVFAEILVTTGGGPGLQSTNLAYLIYMKALIQYDVGAAAAGGVIAVILANIIATFLLRFIGRSLET